MDPGGPSTWVYTILALGNRNVKEASSLIESMAQKAFPGAFVQSVLFVKHAMSASRDEALSAVTPELLATARWDEVLAWLTASGYALLDEKQDALRWLEHAVARGFINYPFLAKFDPFMQNLRGEPRFEQLMQRVKREWEGFEV